jgi:hypothetical protein
MRLIDKLRLKFCRTYRASLLVGSLKNGDLIFDDLNFGGPELCNTMNQPKPSTFKCDFEKDSCGIRTDFCSLYDWTIKALDSEGEGHEWSESFDREKRSFSSNSESKGLALMKRNVTGNSCFYPICIPCFQQSGIDVTVIKHPDDFQISRSRRSFGSLGHALLLDPTRRPGEGVGPAIIDLPEVQYLPANTYLSFYYDMAPNGRHALLVTAICTGKNTNYFIPLGQGRLHYMITNYDGVGSSDLICMHIHHYVRGEACTSFVIQLHAYALDTVVLVDDFNFSSDLPLSCGKKCNCLQYIYCLMSKLTFLATPNNI